MNAFRLLFAASLAAVTVAAFACSDEPAPAAGPDASTEPPDAAEPGPDAGADAGCFTKVACDDAIIQRFAFKGVNSIPPGQVTTTKSGSDFVSVIDATAGGQTPTTSYTYVRFEPNGLFKVAVTDQDSFTHTDWDLGFRRYIARLNSGDSGPSCVGIAEVAAGTTYDSVTAVPSTITQYFSDDFASDDCQNFFTDQLGGPKTGLSSFWDYPASCVHMTGTVYVLKLASGKHVKLTLTNYYNDTAQQECQTGGSVTTSPSGSGTIKMKWAFLD